MAQGASASEEMEDVQEFSTFSGEFGPVELDGDFSRATTPLFMLQDGELATASTTPFGSIWRPLSD
jgi:hypothetical protein